MTSKELREALLSRRHVVLKVHLLGELNYERVSGIVYREKNGKIKAYAELYDKTNRSVTIADPKMIRYAEGKR